ncbi:DEAD/DEAH box helicase [Nakamurella flava]|uniref:RNA helicase n=1 Tax=Nakamurella flava TaxID=2576308 RepID=A0A4V6CU93_9ACTN|nr:DEAD/DEAH box helicase [Nakamurella flava]
MHPDTTESTPPTDTAATDPDGVIADAAIDPDDAAISHPLTAAAPVTPEAPLFAELGVDDRIVRALGEVGIERTFAIQALTLPIALGGSDLIGQARTGMGKTLGFGVPLLQRLTGTELAAGRAPRALVMVPTRELCVQVTRDLHQAAKHVGLTVTAVYGGRAYEPQVAALQNGVDVVVGTPGRLLDLAKSGSLVLGGIQVLVLDEADEMLDLGFLPDIERVLELVPDSKQTMLFSATMPGPIITLARTFMTQPTHIRAELPAEGATHSSTTQFVYRAHALDKVEMLARVLQADGRGLTMVFTRTKRTAAKVAEELAERGFAAAAVHGDLGQGAREQALRAFRSGKIDVLVATDVAARGIDIDDVTHVVNYQCPEDEKTYVHRIGRTGRAGRTGVAVSFIDWDDIPRWALINDALKLDQAEPVETYSTSPHLYADLGIAEGVTGRLPRGQRTRAGLDAEQIEDLGETGGRRRKAAPAGRDGRDGGRGPSRERTRTHGAATDGDSSESREPRRRRTRRSAGGSDAAHADGAAVDATTAPATDGHAPAADGAAPARRRRPRRRTRGGGGEAAATVAGGEGASS